MKKFLRYGLAVAALLVSVSGARAADIYHIDPNHTSVVWTINHFDFSHPWGKFSEIAGTVTLDDKDPQKSKVAVTIPIVNLTTGVAALDDHLKSKEFFDITSYPIATFVSSKVSKTGKDTAKVDGVLNLHGVQKPTTLYVTLNKIGKNMMGAETAGFSATATIKRSDFGMKGFLPGLGDTVKLYIEAEANK